MINSPNSPQTCRRHVRINTLILMIAVTFITSFAAKAQDNKKVRDLSTLACPGILGGQGESSLGDFRGQVLLLMWWDDSSAGLENLNRAVLLAKKHRKAGLRVMLVSTSPWGRDANTTGPALVQHRHKKFSGILSPPISVHNMVKPGFILLSVEGIVLDDGAFQSKSGPNTKLLKKELARQKKGWGDSKLVKKVRSLAYAEGRLVEAWTTMGSLKNDTLRNEIQAYIQRRIDCVANLIDRGYYLQATNNLAQLEKRMRYPSWKARLAQLRSRLASKPLMEALALEQDFEKIRGQVRKNKITTQLEEKLRGVEARAKDPALRQRIHCYQDILAGLIKISGKSS